MTQAKELLKRYAHIPEEFPVLAEQTHKILRKGKIVNERININENIIHYVQDTAHLISVIDGRLSSGGPYDHVIYLDKSARPVSWLVNMFWNDFALKDAAGNVVKRPNHSYINIDRSPWFRNVGISVSDDGRQKENGELATYRDFEKNIHNLNPRHLAEIRALYIDGGIEKEDIEWVMNHPTILDGKRVLIVDEVSRTGATLDIARRLFNLAVPDIGEVSGTYFWHPGEPLLKMGDEYVLTSLPVWYDPYTLTGRGIGNPDSRYYRNLYDHYSSRDPKGLKYDIRKLRTYAFSSSVYGAPLLDENGNPIGLAAEKKTRKLSRDLRRLHDEYKKGHLFFTPPDEWADFEEFDSILEAQGVLLLPWESSREEQERIRELPTFYLNFITKLKTCGYENQEMFSKSAALNYPPGRSALDKLQLGGNFISLG